MWQDEVEKCKNLGLNLIVLGEGFYLIYDQKKKINALRDQIKGYVMPNYTLPIVSPCEIKTVICSDKVCEVNQELRYTGKNVYIGIVTVEGIDYTHEALRTSDGRTRVTCIWKQLEADQGIYENEEHLNQLISESHRQSSNTFSEKQKTYSELLALSGGSTKASPQMASEAQFLVAQIKSAPEKLQYLYGGMPHPSNALLADILIGASKLIELAMLNHKPLVLYLPYMHHLSAHDASDFYEQILEHLGKQPGCVIVTPTGEEADKRHHQDLIGQEQHTKGISLKVSQEKQNVVGMIFMGEVEEPTVSLCVTSQKHASVALDEKGIYKISDATIYTNGIQRDFYNGQQKLFFRIENMPLEGCKLSIQGEHKEKSQSQIWLSQTSLNPYVYMEPNSSSGTMNALGTPDSIISVGGFDEQNQVMLVASGRGNANNERQKPTFAMQARSSNRQMEGTGVAAAYMVGLLACLYDKWQVEEGYPYVGARVIIQHLLKQVSQGDLHDYPNSREGHGMLVNNKLNQLFWNLF